MKITTISMPAGMHWKIIGRGKETNMAGERWITKNGVHIKIKDSKGSLISKINELGEDNEVDNPLKMSPSEVLKNGGREALKRLRTSNTPINYKDEELDISKLETEQATVFKDTLTSIAKNTDGEISGWKTIKNPSSRTDTGIRAVRYKGHVTVVDGNHRVVVAMLNGQKKIKLRVVTI